MSSSLKNLKITYKLAIMVMIILYALISVGVYGTTSGQQLASRATSMYNQNLLPGRWVDRIQLNTQVMESDLLSLMLNSDSSKENELLSDIESRSKDNETVVGRLAGIRSDSLDVEGSMKQFQTIVGRYQAKRDEIISLVKSDRKEDAYKTYTSEFTTLKEQMHSFLDGISLKLEQIAVANYKDANEKADQVRSISIALIVIFTLLSVLAVWYTSRLITKPLSILKKSIQEAQSGDLTASVPYRSRDEIGQISSSFNAMLESLRSMMRRVTETAMTLSSSSEQMTASAEQTSLASRLIAEAASEMAEGFVTQKSGIAETNASVRTMAEDLQSVEQGSVKMYELMNLAAQSADQGSGKVGQVSSQMSEINANVSSTREVISTLARLSDEIGVISTTINDIAGQTNLLSLNASIEAARAGEAGRGFAVVAGEIRKLADETAQSSLHIADIIGKIQTQTGQAVEAMAVGAELALEGVEGSREISGAFQEIVAAIGDAIQQTEAIARSVGQISGESGDLVDVMEVLADISSKGAASVEDVSASSEEQTSAMEEMTVSAKYLATLAEELQQQLERFKL
ncbi:methyl-accepting chemotaxis protein [Paenibacillus spiritus]|uniref:Methyl-accepting chemotaxis protein n=1 Tax=Paenibacillus spiritus TaxID=2496557 RepID=A0A5J5G942_9BACL|nr:methyl-accepting chemotaxis protein [Paenibacillus spiritus]KAA9004709.1 methyl-accepting chemotaxis protein [Paenibacillus spiritus]